MKKLLIFLLFIPCLCNAQWLNMGNTLQRTADGYKYRTALGSPGFAFWYTKGQIDSIISAKSLSGTGYLKQTGTTTSYITAIPNGDLANSAITIQGVSTSLGGSINPINGTGFVKASSTTITYDNSTYLTTAAASSTYAPLASPNFSSGFTSNGVAQFNYPGNTTVYGPGGATHTQYGSNGMAFSDGGQILDSASTNTIYINDANIKLQSGGATYLQTIASTGIVISVPTIDSTIFSVRHLTGYGTAPTISAGSAAGTGATVSVLNAHDLAGTVTVTTGASGLGYGVVLTLILNRTFLVLPHIALTPLNPAAAQLSGSTAIYPVTYTNAFSINTTSTMLAASTTYTWDYIIIQ